MPAVQSFREGKPTSVREYREILKNRPRPRRSGKVQQMLITSIVPNPYQPRLEMDPEEIRALASSIERYGFQGHLEVRTSPVPGETRFELVFGHRRLEACRLAGREKIPVEVVEYSDEEMMEVGLIENVSHVDLNPWDEAQQVELLMTTMNLSVRGIQEILGLPSKTWVENRMALLRLPERFRDLARRNEIDFRVARAINQLAREGATEEELDALYDAQQRNELTGDQFMILQKAFRKAREEAVDERGRPTLTVSLLDQMSRQAKAESKFGKTPVGDPQGPDAMTVAARLVVGDEGIRYAPPADRETGGTRPAAAGDWQWREAPPREPQPEPVLVEGEPRPLPGYRLNSSAERFAELRENVGRRYATAMIRQLEDVAEAMEANLQRADLGALDESERTELARARDRLAAVLERIA